MDDAQRERTIGYIRLLTVFLVVMLLVGWGWFGFGAMVFAAMIGFGGFLLGVWSHYASIQWGEEL